MFRWIMFGVTIVSIVLAILTLIFMPSVEMCVAMIGIFTIVSIFNVVAMLLWWRDKKHMLLEAKWLGFKLK